MREHAFATVDVLRSATVHATLMQKSGTAGVRGRGAGVGGPEPAGNAF